MSLTTRAGLLAGASALMLTGISVADDQTGLAEYEARIAELEQTVARLSGDNWLTEERAEEIRGLVQDVLADADTRASLLQSGMTAGYDDGFVISGDGGNFLLRMNGQLQTRFVYNNQDDGVDPVLGANTDDANRWGFEATRTKLIFSGHVGSPSWGYYVEGDFARDGGDFNLDDAYITYDMGNGWAVMMGQAKVPLNHEWLVHSRNQLAVERSNVSYFFSGGRTQGVMVDYKSDQFHMTGGITDGAFGEDSPWSDEDVEWASTWRAEFLLSGNWEQFADFTSKPGSEQGIMIGAGFHYEVQEYGTATPDELAFYILTGDVNMEFDGWNAHASINYADFDDDNLVDFSPIGVVLQGGLYFNDKWEGFLRYEWTDFDDFGGPGADVDDLSLLTVGVNGYYSDNIKMTADIGFAFDAVPVATDITGVRVDQAGEDGQYVLRTQLQLTF